MDPVEAILRDAEALGLRPWLLIKEKLAALAVRIVGNQEREAVLQGGAGLHFAYGSPRLSADVDFVGRQVVAALEQVGPQVAAAAEQLLSRPARWALDASRPLARGKLTVEMDAVRRLVLPVEAYAVPAHHCRVDPALGRVEEPEEIAADKIVASASRVARRGTLKTTDLYDLWYLRTRLGIAPPPRSLLRAKAADYGDVPAGADPAALAHSVPLEELESVLTGVLPADELATLELREVIERAAELLARWRDVD